jgi:hypothetical protein
MYIFLAGFSKRNYRKYVSEVGGGGPVISYIRIIQLTMVLRTIFYNMIHAFLVVKNHNECQALF